MTSKLLTIQQHTFVQRSPIFYGWIIWIVATLGILATMPGQSATLSLFIDDFIADFGLNRATVSGLYGLGTFIASLSLTWVGHQIDRYGNQRVGLAITALFVLALFSMSLVTGPLTLLFGFIAIRGLGQGSMFLVNSTVIAQWFKSRRGRVLSIALVIFALFQSVYIPALQQILKDTDWRQVWILLGISIAAIMLPLIWLLMRDRPEDFGLQPDGVANIPNETQESLLEEDNWTLSEAMRTAAFWIYALARIVPPAWGTGLILHQISLFGGLGHSPETAALIFGSISIVIAISALVGGYLVDRAHPSIIVVVQLSTFGLACGIATVMTESWMLLLYALAFGAGQGVGNVFDGAVWANLFGRLHQGSIRGFIATIGVTGSAIGPVIFGISYDTLGGYAPVLWVGVALSALGALASLFARKPQKRALRAS